MDATKAAKASNAIVAVTDFYGSALGDLLSQLKEAQAALGMLTEHSKTQAAEIEALQDRLTKLAGPVHALLLSGDQSPFARELREAYEQTIGPVHLADAIEP